MSITPAQVTMAIMRYAEQHDIDSAALMLGMAEVVGITAGLLDKHAGRQSFTERMESFTEHAHAVYRRGPPQDKPAP